MSNFFFAPAAEIEGEDQLGSGDFQPMPPGVYRRGRKYRMRVCVNGVPRWRDLGPDLDAARRLWAEIVGADSPAHTVAELCDRYAREVLPRKARRTQQGQAQ